MGRGADAQRRQPVDLHPRKAWFPAVVENRFGGEQLLDVDRRIEGDADVRVVAPGDDAGDLLVVLEFDRDALIALISRIDMGHEAAGGNVADVAELAVLLGVKRSEENTSELKSIVRLSI